VSRSLRRHIVERDAVLVFVKQLRRDLPAKDASEHVRRIVCQLVLLRWSDPRATDNMDSKPCRLPGSTPGQGRNCLGSQTTTWESRRLLASFQAAMRSKPFAIAIAGGSGSGKTSLTRALLAVLGPERCCVLDHDSYYKDLSHQPAPVRAATNFDHPNSLDNALIAEHIRGLLAGQKIQRPRYDFATHTRLPTTEPVEARPVVICEGILLLAVPELRRSFDVRIYIDTPADVRALRRLQRDIDERGRTVGSVIQQYFETVRPMHEQYVEPARRTADVVLDWRQTAAMQAKLVLQRLAERLNEQPASSTHS
jgi:uridine kinase